MSYPPSSCGPPPKFQGTAPGSLLDWVNFFRWLLALWRKTSASVDAPQSIAISPASSGGNAWQAQQTLGAAQVFQGGRPQSVRAPEQLAVCPIRQPQSAVHADALTSLTAYALGKPPYPARIWAAEGTHANRLALYPATSFPDGAQFYETDRTAAYVNVAGVWIYSWGEMVGKVTTLPTDLGEPDWGFRIRVTTGLSSVAYDHVVRWCTDGWYAADALGGFFRDFALVPTEPGWHPCDGSATTCLRLTAGVVSEVAFTTPNLMAGVYRKSAAAYTGTITAAGTVTLGGNTSDVSAGTPAGTNSAPALTMNSYTPAGTNSAPALTMNSYTPVGAEAWVANTFSTSFGPTQLVISGGAFTGTPATLTGTVAAPVFTGTLATLTGTVAAPVFSGTALAVHHHALTGGTVTLTGDPVANLAVLTYFRR